MGLWQRIHSYFKKTEPPKAVSRPHTASPVTVVLPDETKALIKQQVDEECASILEKLRKGESDLEHVLNSINIGYHQVASKHVNREPHGPQRTARAQYLSKVVQQVREEAEKIYYGVLESRTAPPQETPWQPPAPIFTSQDASLEGLLVPDVEHPTQETVSLAPSLLESAPAPQPLSSSELNRERTRILRELGREFASVNDKDVLGKLSEYRAQHPDLALYFKDDVQFTIQIAAYRAVKLALDAQHAERVACIQWEEQAQSDWDDALTEQHVRITRARRNKAGKLPVAVLEDYSIVDHSLDDWASDVARSQETIVSLMAKAEDIEQRIENTFIAEGLAVRFQACKEGIIRELEPFIETMTGRIVNKDPALADIINSDKSISDYVQGQMRNFYDAHRALFAEIPDEHRAEVDTKFDWYKDIAITKAHWIPIRNAGIAIVKEIVAEIKTHEGTIKDLQEKKVIGKELCLPEHLTSEYAVEACAQERILDLRRKKEQAFQNIPSTQRRHIFRSFAAVYEHALLRVKAVYKGGNIESSVLDDAYEPSFSSSDEMPSVLLPEGLSTKELQEHIADVSEQVLTVPREVMDARLQVYFEEHPEVAVHYSDFMGFYSDVVLVHRDKLQGFERLSAQLDAEHEAHRKELLGDIGQLLTKLADERARITASPLVLRELDWEEGTALSKMEYAQETDRIVKEYVPRFDALGKLPVGKRMVAWEALENEVKNALQDTKSEEMSRFEQDFQDLVYRITEQVPQLTFTEEPASSDIERAHSDAETIPEAEGTPVNQQIDDLPVATEPKALYTPPVIPVFSHDSDQKGVAYSTPKEKPMANTTNDRQQHFDDFLSFLETLLDGHRENWKHILAGKYWIEYSIPTESFPKESEAKPAADLALFLNDHMRSNDAFAALVANTLPDDASEQGLQLAIDHNFLNDDKRSLLRSQYEDATNAHERAQFNALVDYALAYVRERSPREDMIVENGKQGGVKRVLKYAASIAVIGSSIFAIYKGCSSEHKQPVYNGGVVANGTTEKPVESTKPVDTTTPEKPVDPIVPVKPFEPVVDAEQQFLRYIANNDKRALDVWNTQLAPTYAPLSVPKEFANAYGLFQS
ncbi:hypothetical protein HY492_00135, partial [Candidatus Woesearchaeota archaeon]|nr:hypothetical protein [Candidatus Woesearchaeota archaeon]